jgi:hypothetical protein
MRPSRPAPARARGLDAVVGVVVVGGVLAGASCGAASVGEDDACEPWAVEVVAFAPGDGAGFGRDGLPDVVLGPPDGGKTTQGALDVVSLGVGGVITLRLGCPAVDADGPDLFVYENAFVVDGTARSFADPAEVAVSADGEAWTPFPCAVPASPVADDDGIDGCAGLAPVLANADNDLAGRVEGGGDAFDLGSLGVGTASFVRITDRSTAGAAPHAGFDLDAVAVARR